MERLLWLLIAILITAPAQAAMVADWHMDDSVGATIVDSSGNSNDLTVANQADCNWGQTGVVGTSINNAHAGSDCSASRADTATLSITGSFTLSLWATTTDTFASKGFFGKNSSSGEYDYMLYRGSNGSVNVFMKDSSGNAASCEDVGSSSTFASGVWHHWLGTFDATANKLRIYRDGSRKNECNGPANSNTRDSNLTMIMWKGFGGSSSIAILGIDEARVYNTACDDTSCQAIYCDSGGTCAATPTPSPSPTATPTDTPVPTATPTAHHCNTTADCADETPLMVCP